MGKYFRLLCVLLVSGYFWYYAKTYTDWHFLDNVNVIFHEAGHTIFRIFGIEFFTVLMGSGFQILLPASIALYFFMNEQKISGALCLFWVAQNILNVSVYAGDAIVMELPLLGGGAENAIHDWNYMLESLNLITYTNIVASVIHATGLLMLFTATVLSIWFCIQKINTENTALKL